MEAICGTLLNNEEMRRLSPSHTTVFERTCVVYEPPVRFPSEIAGTSRATRKHHTCHSRVWTVQPTRHVR